MTLKKSMTPRQRCAISHPVVSDPDSETHARHLNRHRGTQAILTLEVSHLTSFKDYNESLIARSVDGWLAAWHARVSMRPVRHVDLWPTRFTDNACRILKDLLEGVGVDGDFEFHNGSDLQSIHVYKWSTHEEIRLAEKELGRSFEDAKGKESNDQT